MRDAGRTPGIGRDPGTAGIAELLRHVTRELAAAGVPEPASEARQVLKAAGLSAEDIVARREERLDAEVRRRVAGILSRRMTREPLSRIVGEREFYGRAFRVTPATLDPRADTETLIDAALELAAEEGWHKAPLRILDIGTGTGCLLVTLLAELPQASGVGTDICPEALAVAAENAGRHGVTGRARFEMHRSLGGRKEAFDLLVANPPYIPTGDIADLDPEVRGHDPLAALDGGADGLAVYREIAPALTRAVPRGWALFEAGAGQAEAVRDILAGNTVAEMPRTARFWRDLGGHIRCIGVKSCE